MLCSPLHMYPEISCFLKHKMEQGLFNETSFCSVRTNHVQTMSQERKIVGYV
eukprot:TRINITY_DN15711_c0_g1_i1.p2 TRINITY_DN15711_c0_g1~~TRINITY_DN15711_c0_g1_i1.p2  ORF type:complete len:52 (+),score=6.22 TRINITY_DN15711_c0_g1_i1:87-242(+)